MHIGQQVGGHRPIYNGPSAEEVSKSLYHQRFREQSISFKRTHKLSPKTSSRKKTRLYPATMNTTSLSYTVSVVLDQVNNPSPRQLRQQPRHMIPQIPPSLRWLVHDLWTKRVRSPELDQQAVEVHPFPLNRFQSCVADEGRAG